jgi:predicted lipid-binding transport protein (Tim44 family)
MKRQWLTTTVLAGALLAGAGFVAAAPPKDAPPAAKAAPADHQMGGGMMGGGMMGGGMMGMMAMCPMGAANTQIAVKNSDKGVTITFTSSEPAQVTRLQKMAEAMRLMHEAHTQ